MSGLVTAEGVANWSNEIRKKADFETLLNVSFDRVGFDDQFLKNFSLAKYNSTKFIKDKIWGMIELSPIAVAIMDTPLFQRLRAIRQLGFTYLTYPTAHHSRFEHSLGVYHVVYLLNDQIAKTREDAAGTENFPRPTSLSPHDRETVRIAAMLHDVGHGPFSHVSEAFFSEDREKSRFATYSVQKFVEITNDVLGDIISTSKPRLPLAELMSAVIVTSGRFRRFLNALLPRFNKLTPPNQDIEVDAWCYQIATLILGGRLRPNDLATPAILSGPTDADKLDYLLRDSRECGIPIGIDISRALLRAGIYEFSKEAVQPFIDLRGIGDNTIKLFVIDRAGQDTYQELGAARLSLYSRIYHHPFTRRAELYFRTLCQVARDNLGSNQATAPHNNFVEMWAWPEDVLLDHYRASSDPAARRLAVDLINRNLPSRAASYSELHFADRIPSGYRRFMKGMDGKGHEVHQQRIVESLDETSTTDGGRTRFRQEILAYASDIKNALLSEVRFSALAPESSAPDHLFLEGRPDPDEPMLKEAYILNADGSLARSEHIFPSYYHAGALSREVGYIFSDRDWKEVIAIAFQKYVVDKFSGNFEFEASPQLNIAAKLPSAFHPIVRLDEVAQRCKLNASKIRRIQDCLSAKQFYEACPYLVPTDHLISEAIELADKFRSFQGDLGFRVDQRGVLAFLAQIPPQLRDEVIQLLREHFLVLDREESTNLLVERLGLLPSGGPRMSRIAPLTLSSGTRARDCLRSYSEQSPHWGNHTSLRDALTASVDGDRIVLVDDNIGSGTQASKQIRAWFGLLGETEADDNIERNPLSPDQQALLRAIDCNFVFCVGDEAGREKLFTTCQSAQLKLDRSDIAYAREFSTYSAKAKISNPLREFFRHVGRSLLYRRRARRHKKETEAEWRQYAEENALGYGGREALLASSWNVPTATYTALWCPGVYWPDKALRTEIDSMAIPWLPLLLRTATCDSLVLP